MSFRIMLAGIALIGTACGEPDGAELWNSKCAACHAADGTGSATAPDIRLELSEMSVGEIETVITEGTEDMPFIPGLSEEEVTAVATWSKENLGDPGAVEDD